MTRSQCRGVCARNLTEARFCNGLSTPTACTPIVPSPPGPRGPLTSASSYDPTSHSPPIPPLLAPSHSQGKLLVPPCIHRSERSGLVEVRLELEDRSHRCMLSRVTADVVRVHVTGLMANDSVHEELFDLFARVGNGGRWDVWDWEKRSCGLRAVSAITGVTRSRRWHMGLRFWAKEGGGWVSALLKAFSGSQWPGRRRATAVVMPLMSCISGTRTRYPQVLNVRLSQLDIRRAKSSRNRIMTVESLTPEQVRPCGWQILIEQPQGCC